MTRSLLYLAAASLLSLGVSGHAYLLSPAPRKAPGSSLSYEAPGNKISTYPPTEADLNSCSNSQPGPIDPSNVFASGSTIDVKWNMTKEHPSDPGVRVAIQFPGDSKFTVLKEKINVKDAKVTVQLPPGKTADKAVLHWLWDVASEKAFYIGCADITIQPGNAAAAGASSNNSTSSTSTTTTQQTANGETVVTTQKTVTNGDSTASTTVSETKPNTGAPAPGQEEDVPDCEDIITSNPGKVELPVVKDSKGKRVKTIIETKIVYKCAP